VSTITSEGLEVEFDEKLILKQLRDFRKSTSWITENIAEIRKGYPDRHIAVLNGKIIDSDVDFDALIGRLRGKYDMSRVTIEYIPSKEVIMVL
jgi:hypothetical protein